MKRKGRPPVEFSARDLARKHGTSAATAWRATHAKLAEIASPEAVAMLKAAGMYRQKYLSPIGFLLSRGMPPELATKCAQGLIDRRAASKQRNRIIDAYESATDAARREFVDWIDGRHRDPTPDS